MREDGCAHAGLPILLKPSSRATAMSVIPATSAVRRASAVGADTAATIGDDIRSGLFPPLAIKIASIVTHLTPCSAHAGENSRANHFVKRRALSDVAAIEQCRRG